VAGTDWQGDSASNRRLKLDWVYEKISKQNSNALRYCGFEWFELSLRTARQNKWL